MAKLNFRKPNFIKTNFCELKTITTRNGRPEFNCRAGQIRHNVANGLPPLQCFSREAALPRRNKADGLGQFVTRFNFFPRVRKCNDRSLTTSYSLQRFFQVFVARLLLQSSYVKRQTVTSAVLSQDFVSALLCCFKLWSISI